MSRLCSATLQAVWYGSCLLFLALATAGAALGQWYDSSRYRIDPIDITDKLHFSLPGAHNIDGSALDAAVSQFQNNRVRSVIVMVSGSVILERYYNGADAQETGNVHSMSKSVMGALGFILVGQGKLNLDQPISEIVPRHFTDYPAGDERRDITTRHLMQMSTGLRWTEDSTEYAIGRGDTWVQDVLDQGLSNTPGSRFRYSTGNTHVLSAVLEHAAGEPLEDFAQRELFNELGIMPDRWLSDPEGYKCGGYNFYLTPREMALFGLLYQREGAWQGRQIIPVELVRASRQRGVTSSYGLLWWRTTVSGESAQQAWGWGSQMVYVVPSKDLVVVTTADHNSGSETNDQSLVSNIVDLMESYEPSPAPDPDPIPEPDPDPTPEPESEYVIRSKEILKDGWRAKHLQRIREDFPEGEWEPDGLRIVSTATLTEAEARALLASVDERWSNSNWELIEPDPEPDPAPDPDPTPAPAHYFIQSKEIKKDGWRSKHLDRIRSQYPEGQWQLDGLRIVSTADLTLEEAQQLMSAVDEEWPNSRWTLQQKEDDLMAIIQSLQRAQEHLDEAQANPWSENLKEELSSAQLAVFRAAAAAGELYGG